MPQIQIIKAVKTDYPILIQVWERSVRATHHFLSEADIAHYRQLILSEYFDQVTLFFTLEAPTVTGFIGVHENHVQMLFIDDEYRSKGIGKGLLQFAIEKLDIKGVTVNEQNEQALGFYQHLGFETVERFERDGAGKPYPILQMRYLHTGFPKAHHSSNFIIPFLSLF
jgi:putative acetyltransferase